MSWHMHMLLHIGTTIQPELNTLMILVVDFDPITFILCDLFSCTDEKL